MTPFPDNSHLYNSASSVNGHEFISLLQTQTEDFGVGLQLETLIHSDNKQAFVSYLKTQQFDYHSLDYLHFRTRLLKLLCFRRAIGCATALLNGETGLPPVDLNLGLIGDPLEDDVGDHPTPLQIAAKILCYGLTDLFIQHGADATLQGPDTREAVSILPLNLALDTLCDHEIVKDFPAGESVTKLFSVFRLQELKEGLDTIKLLVSRTRQQQVTVLGVCCVEKWNLVKLAVLLIFAWDKLVIDDNIYSCPIAKLIGLQHGVESDLEKKQITRSMLQAFRLVEMSRNLLKENRTSSKAQHEGVPLEVANKFRTDVKLHDTNTHMVSADSDRLAAELLRRNKDFLEAALAEKNYSMPCTWKFKMSADLHRKLHLTRWATVLRLGDKVLLETRLMEEMSSESKSKCIYTLPRYERRTEQAWHDDFICRLSDAMLLDDRYEFVKLVNGVKSFHSLGFDDDLPEIVRERMFVEDSANCVAAVLAGETDAVLTFRDLTDVGWSFLHMAAKHGASKLTALFLENGFLADDRRDCDELKIKAALPLNVALENIRNGYLLRDWKDNKSATDLVVLLCNNEFRNILETIRLLVQKTTDVYSEYSRYLKEEKMVELCALLMVAHKELLRPDFVGHTLVPESTTHKARVAGHTRFFSARARHGNSHEHNDPLERKRTHLLVDIFGKIGDYLSAYIRLEQIKPCYQLTGEAAWLVGRAGISDALVSETTNTSSRMYVADEKRASERVHSNTLEQHCRPKLLGGSRCPKQAPQSMSWRRGASSSRSMVFPRVLHTPVPEINADFASFVPAKRLVDVLGRRHSPMRCISIVAALTSGFRRM
ncbi:uncharacterized protein LOC141656313 isoform X2 [Silene latifolia]|uniref:uncharacterized protein LOC141656313 isoform X2 n=1 Tax=Silene latifolia TaxID=37657 RepID=UPI003D77E93C